MLYSINQSTAVIATLADWSSAFDRIDQTMTIKKFIKLGVRPSLIQILISYISERKMKVKANGVVSSVRSLVGGGPAGTLLGQLFYIAASDDCALVVSDEDKFKYIDDLNLLELILLSELLVEYNILEHVPSDVSIGDKFLPANATKTQGYISEIAEWTTDNKMLLNEDKSKYIVFKKTFENFCTRFTMNEQLLGRVSEAKILGVWFNEKLDWSTNTNEICKKAY